MSVRIMTAVWGVTLPDSEKIVLLALADCANDEGLCWPSMATLAKKCSKSDRTVQAAIKSLVSTGHMSRQEIAGRGCRYIIHPTPEATSPPKPLHPRSEFAPEEVSPPKGMTATPEAASDKPSRTITSPKASPSPRRARSSEPKAKPFRLPADWKPIRFGDDTVARAIVDRRGIEWARAALESFRGWAANAEDKDGKGRKLDWQSAWSNWVIEQDQRHGTRTGNGSATGKSRSGHGRTVDAAQRFLARRGSPGPDTSE